MLSGVRKLPQKCIWALLVLASFIGAWSRQQEVLQWPRLSAPLGPTDPDGWVRLSQVRQWLQGKDFYDHTIAATNAPFGGIEIHWTRPVDFLLALLTHFAPGDSIEQRLMVAAAWFAPLLGLFAIGFLYLGARRLFNSLHVLGCMAMLCLFSTTLYNHFEPGNADHHGMLAMLWCGIIALVVVRPSIRAGALIGVLLGVMTWMSPEALLLAAAVYAVLGFYALKDPKEMIPLSAALATAALTVFGGLLLEVPPDRVFSHVTYDTLSIVHVTLYGLLAAGGAVLAVTFQHVSSLRARVLATGAVGCVIALAQYALFPKFFLGPFADADPFIFKGYLPLVKEAQPLFKSPLAIPIIAQPVFAAFLLIGKWSRHAREGRRRSATVLGVLLAVTFCMVAFQIRYMYYVQPVAIAIIAAYLPGIAGQAGRFLRWLKPLPLGYRPYVCIFLLALVAALGTHLTSQPPSRVDYCYAEMRYAIQTNQLPAALGKNDLILLGPEKVSGDILFFTHDRLVTLRFHREGKAMRDLQDIVDAASASAAKDLLAKRKVGAIFACTADYDESSWMRSLSATRHPAWAKPVTGLHFMAEATPKPLLFRVTSE